MGKYELLLCWWVSKYFREKKNTANSTNDICYKQGNMEKRLKSCNVY